MQKIVIFIAVLFSFGACDLNNLEPAQTKAFMKFFGDEGNTFGIDLLKLDDGYLLLGNNISPDGFTSIMIKVDESGNQLWASNFPNLRGSALAKSTDGYFLIGDSIDNTTNPPTTSMRLIKTNLEGTETATASLSQSGTSSHGSSVTVSLASEVVITGYIEGAAAIDADTTFLYGYDNNLTPTWTIVRKYLETGVSVNLSNSLIEDVGGGFVWTSLDTQDGGATYELKARSAPRDSDIPLDNQPLLSNRTIDNNNLGDFNISSFGGVLVQTVLATNGTNSAIAMSNYVSGVEQFPALIESEGVSLRAHTVVQATDGDFVILGSTDVPGRPDTDFYLTKVGLQGVTGTTGFTQIIGGTGSESAAAIVQADDKGFVFLGTMRNTSDINLMMLVKVNSNGELIN